MKTPRRGDVWTLAGRHPRTVLVVSSTVYNEITSEPTIVTVPIVRSAADEGFCVRLNGSQWAVVARISYEPKAILNERRGQVDVQTLTDVNNMLFKILATPDR